MQVENWICDDYAEQNDKCTKPHRHSDTGMVCRTTEINQWRNTEQSQSQMQYSYSFIDRFDSFDVIPKEP